MRFDINLASQPYQDVQRFLVRWGIAVLALAVLAVGLAYAAIHSFLSWRVTEKQVHYLQQQIAERDREKTNVEAFLNRPENRDTRERSEFLNSLIARKAFSWTEIFTDLEQIMPSRLHVTSIHPEVNDKSELELHLAVAGAAHESAIELVRSLEQSPHFTQAEIISESLQTTRNQGSVWQFEISAVYIPNFARRHERASPPAAPKADENPPAHASSTPLQTAKEARNGRY